MITIPVRLAATSDRSYDVVCGVGLAESCAAALRRAAASRAVVVSDEAVAASHARCLQEALAATGIVTSLLTVPRGEPSKSVAELARLWEACAAAGIDRTTHIVAVGGGVVGDLAGFLAATFMRGLPFWQVPTTVVAQVDSSVGGKTGINLPAGKNLVGAFWQPCGVFADIATLATLPDREYVSGLAEVVKYGMILDAAFFAWLEEHTAALVAREPDALLHVVRRSVELKAAVVEADERETSGARAALNYGHTFGHAYEAVAGYGRLLHGEAVAIGMARAARLALALGRLAPEVVERQNRLLEALGLPISPAGLIDAPPAEALLAAMGRDKKAIGGRLRFVLPDRVGHGDLIDGVPEPQVLTALVADA